MTNEDKDGHPEIFSPASNPATASFGPQMPGQVLVNVTADNLNIHPSSLSALERIAEKSPAIASQLIDSTDHAVKTEARKYIVSSISAALVALAIIVGSATVIIEAGAFAGLFFFLACVAASAIMTAIFTGKAQDLSWTVKLLHRSDDASSGARDPQ